MRKVRAHKPDVAIIDVRMPPDNSDDGLRAALSIREELPDVGILLLSQYVEDRYIGELLAGGTEGVGYLLKDRVGEVERFTEAVQRVGAGRLGARPRGRGADGRPRGRSRSSELTEREREVLALMAEGVLQPGDRRDDLCLRARRGAARDERSSRSWGWRRLGRSIVACWLFCGI